MRENAPKPTSAVLAVPAPVRAAVPAFRGALRSERRAEARAAYLFILPTLFGFFVFVAGPLLASIYLSFTKYDVLTAPRPTGLDNYRRMFTDARVISSFRNTAIFVVFSTALEMTVALLLAVGVQRRMPRPLRYLFRTAYFLPIITSGAAMGIVFGYLFNKDFGIINFYLGQYNDLIRRIGLGGVPIIGQIGTDRVPWITSTRYSLWTVIVAAAWQRLGFTFILFTAGLQNIPRDLYEAADLDGATGWTRLTRITIPLLSPTILFTGVIGVINGLQVFDLPTIITRGGPGDSSRTIVMLIREAGFGNTQFGYASAIAVALFAIILLLTLFQFWASQRWVHYR